MQLHAQPYNRDAAGFYYETYAEYLEKSQGHTDMHGNIVEEYEIQFIEGSAAACEFCNAASINQGNQEKVFEYLETYEDNEHGMILAILQMIHYSDSFEWDTAPENYDIQVYYENSMKDLAYEFVDSGMYGDIPEHLENYIDYEGIARDLSFEYTEDRILNNDIIWLMH